jgi:hypothetical protein
VHAHARRHQSGAFSFLSAFRILQRKDSRGRECCQLDEQ